MEIKILRARVAHKREKPVRNAFDYRVYYVDMPVVRGRHETPRLFSYERFNVWSVYTRDHGARNETPWIDWFTRQCAEHGVTVDSRDHIRLIAHPRLFGYAFNPITFWILQNAEHEVKAVLCEVNNTFGDSHNYFLAAKKGFITPQTTLYAEKNLYVSPFNHMEGGYEFTFDISPDTFSAAIIYKVDGEVSLSTWMGGSLQKLSSTDICLSLVHYPLMTFMVMARIHWQALKLWLKGVQPTVASMPQPTHGNTTTGSDSSA